MVEKYSADNEFNPLNIDKRNIREVVSGLIMRLRVARGLVQGNTKPADLPRSGDNKIGKNSRVPIRTVSRKRNRLEEEGLISYYTNVNMGSKGTGRFGARQLYLIKFRLGITREQMIKEIKEEKMVNTREVD